jgi:hypothetical protein
MRNAALLAAAAALAVVLALVVPAVGAARALAGLVVVFLPAAILARVLAPSATRRLGVAVVMGGFALAMIPLGGLVLNLLPIGVRPTSWLLLGGALLVLAIVIAGGAQLRLDRLPRPTAPPLRDIAMYGGALLLVGAAIAVAGTRGEVVERFSQAWLVPAEGPAGAGLAPADTAQIGVRNLEGVATTYRVDLLRDGQVLESWPDVTLPEGGVWTAAIDEIVAANERLEARVYRAPDGDTPYRVVYLVGPLERRG